MGRHRLVVSLLMAVLCMVIATTPNQGRGKGSKTPIKYTPEQIAQANIDASKLIRKRLGPPLTEEELAEEKREKEQKAKEKTKRSVNDRMKKLDENAKKNLPFPPLLPQYLPEPTRPQGGVVIREGPFRPRPSSSSSSSRSSSQSSRRPPVKKPREFDLNDEYTTERDATGAPLDDGKINLNLAADLPASSASGPNQCSDSSRSSGSRRGLNLNYSPTSSQM